jgi:hypothetical protein
MKVRSVVMGIAGVAAACSLMVMAGCMSSATVGTSATGPTQTVATPPPRTPSTEFVAPTPVGPITTADPVKEEVPGGVIDWTGKVVRARGTGVLDPGNTNTAQARLMAERAATVVAQRNLLEIIKGVRVDSDTRVQNFMTDYDVVYSHVDGIVKGARQLGTARYDSIAGTVEVELEVNLYGGDGVEAALGPALAEAGSQVSAASATPEVQEFLRQYSGLVFDAGNSGVQPSLFPKIYDENGNLLLDTRDYLKYTGQPGAYAVQFVGKVQDILNRPEFANVPLVLKVKQAAGKLGADIVLGRQEVDKLGWLKTGFRFLMDAGRFIIKLAL